MESPYEDAPEWLQRIITLAIFYIRGSSCRRFAISSTRKVLISARFHAQQISILTYDYGIKATWHPLKWG
jgi:hypothetical protein